MSRPRTRWRIAREALLAIGSGATVRQAAEVAGLSPRTVDRLIWEHGRMTMRERTPRTNVLSLEEREEIRVGIDRNESDAVIATRLGRHRSTVWREIRHNGGRHAYRAFRARTEPTIRPAGHVPAGSRSGPGSGTTSPSC